MTKSVCGHVQIMFIIIVETSYIILIHGAMMDEDKALIWIFGTLIGVGRGLVKFLFCFGHLGIFCYLFLPFVWNSTGFLL